MKTLLLCSLFISLSFLSGCERKIGDCKVYTEDNEVFVDGFNYTMGIGGLGSVDFNVDFDELDEYIYDFCMDNSNYGYVYVTLIAVDGEDGYGNKEYERITIGKIDTYETQKYTSFSKWKNVYGTRKMFYKDKKEYDEREARKMRNMEYGKIYFSERYMPESIK